MKERSNQSKLQQLTETKTTIIIGRVASIFSIMMYVAYIAQISNNLQGSKGSPIQPLCATINSIFWVAYGLMKRHKDWPLIIANVPGVLLGFITFITSF